MFWLKAARDDMGNIIDYNIALESFSIDEDEDTILTASCVTMTELSFQIAEMINKLRDLHQEAMDFNTWPKVYGLSFVDMEKHLDIERASHWGEKEYRRGYYDGFQEAEELIVSFADTIGEFNHKVLNSWRYEGLPNVVEPKRLYIKAEVRKGLKYDTNSDGST